MEFCEKLKVLRKNKGLTQEELAQVLYVSRTAISKWESGRGYPSVDSLKAIAEYFSVTVDELLSGEKLLFIAEKENKLNIRKICEIIFSFTDICSVMLILLPLYPNVVQGYIYSVNLFSYIRTNKVNFLLYVIMFSALVLMGAAKLLLTKFNNKKQNDLIAWASMVLGVIVVLFLSVTRVVYATAVALLLLVIKGVTFFKMYKM